MYYTLTYLVAGALGEWVFRHLLAMPEGLWVALLCALATTWLAIEEWGPKGVYVVFAGGLFLFSGWGTSHYDTYWGVSVVTSLLGSIGVALVALPLLGLLVRWWDYRW